eukprot:scaffold7523_cov132-Isochrysis_galbana.AAC.6
MPPPTRDKEVRHGPREARQGSRVRATSRGGVSHSHLEAHKEEHRGPAGAERLQRHVWEVGLRQQQEGGVEGVAVGSVGGDRRVPRREEHETDQRGEGEQEGDQKEQLEHTGEHHHDCGAGVAQLAVGEDDE